MKFHLPATLPATKLPRIGDRQKASRDWLIMTSLALLVFVASLGWNVWTFLRITNGEVVGGEGAEIKVPDITAVERAREVFTARALESERYRTEYRFVDPSK